MVLTSIKSLLKFIYKITHILDAAFAIILLVAALNCYMNDQWTSFVICFLFAMISFALFLKRPVQNLLKNKFKSFIDEK